MTPSGEGPESGGPSTMRAVIDFRVAYLYIVHVKSYSVAIARARLAELLDASERGEPVFIERHGVRHALAVAEPAGQWTTRRPRLEILDADVEAGEWQWDWKGKGVSFRGRSRRKR